MTDEFYDITSYTPRISLGYLLRRVSKLSGSRIETAFQDSDITFTQWIVLALVSSDTANTCTALARDMDHNSGAMTRLIDQLEERGLIIRTRAEKDRRISKLSITDAGNEMKTMLAARVAGVWNEIITGFDHDDIRQLITTLTKLLDRIEALEAESGQSA